MHRATPSNTSLRSYVSGGSRATIKETDDDKEMQETNGNMMKGESRGEVEHPQNYGFSSRVADADEGENGEFGDSAEGFMSYMGGNRSFPVLGVLDDRRHRIKGIGKGDSAMFRGREDRQQFHLHEKGNFMTAREDKKMRFALVPKEQQQGGGGGGGQGGGQQQRQYGQKPTYDDNEKSKTYYEMTDGHHKFVHEKGSKINEVGRNHTVKAGNNTQFEASKHIRKGETHRDRQMFVNGLVHATDHRAGGGTNITSSDDWNAQGRPGTTSLLQTAAKVGTMGKMMPQISQIFGMVSGLLAGAGTPQQQQQLQQVRRELEENLQLLQEQEAEVLD